MFRPRCVRLHLSALVPDRVMKLDLISLASFILVPGLALGAPLGTRENDSLLTPATLRAIEALLVQTNVPGMSIVLTTPDKDEILNFGNATIFGEPVTDDVGHLSWLFRKRDVR